MLIVAMVVGALAVGTSVLALRPSGGEPASVAVSTTPPVATGPVSAAQVRADNPQFAGKSIGIIDITAGERANPSAATVLSTAIHLTRTPLPALLESIGFVYYSGFARVGDEVSPRVLDNMGRYDTLGKNYAADYVLVIRSDPGSGAGSLLGLDDKITSVSAKVIVVDDSKAVVALRNYVAGSDQQALESLVPILRRHIT
ncbi:hypothetical protein ACTWPB_04245 [Nocardia sp. IBHARD005]|uniref:hypothetical protein n=1 Tax=Nocardia sp. IBHARD005 TaxID=3457765 RepID=UPI004058959B